MGAPVAWLWVAACAAAAARVRRPAAVPAVIAAWAAGMLAGAARLWYRIAWEWAAASAALQLAAALVLWTATRRGVAGPHTAAAAYCVQWAGHLFALLWWRRELSGGVAPAVSTAEQWAVPASFLAVGFAAVLRSVQVRRGGLLPAHLPPRCAVAAHAAAVVLQLLAGFYAVRFASDWAPMQEKRFLTMAAFALGQDAAVNEPLKLLVLTHAAPMLKTVAKSFVGASAKQLLERSGILPLLRALAA